MGRRMQIEWEEDEATLKERYLAEKESQRRTRLQAMWQLRQGKTTAEVAEIVGRHQRTIQEWVAWYRQGGLAKVLKQRQGEKGGKVSWLSQEQLEQLKAAAGEGEIHSIQDGMKWVKEHQGVSYSYWGMRSIFVRLGLKRKVPRPRNPKASAAVQEAWKKGG